MTAPRNIPASIHQRLLNLARSGRRPFNELLQYFAMERFLFRLSKSAHADRFILKGALMLRVWRSPDLRPTMDIDLLGRADNAEDLLVAQVRDILAVDVEADGLVFDPSAVQAEPITEDAEYEGIRVRFPGCLGTARIHMQIDVGFGDVVYPEPQAGDLPAMLDFPAPRLLCYSRESVIAEKLEAMVKLAGLNTRMKDFHDIWLLSRQFDFDGRQLAQAIRLTFMRRGRALPSQLEAVTDPFADGRQIQWAAFRDRLQQEHVPASFVEIAASLDGFLSPVVAAAGSGETGPVRWTAPGPWT